MAEYRYAGPHPVPDEQGELVHPGEVREFDAEPSYGPWELLDEPPEAEAVELGHEPPTLAATPFLAAPVTPEGM